MKKLFVALLAFVATTLFSLSQVGCALKHEVEPIEVKPVLVKLQIDTEKLETYYEEFCLVKYEEEYLPSFSDPADPDILSEEEFVDNCIEENIGEFMDAFSTAVVEITK